MNTNQEHVRVQTRDCVFRITDNKNLQLVIIYTDHQHLLLQELSLSLSLSLWILFARHL